MQKTDLRVAAFGTIDEANAVIGVARAEKLSHQTDAVLGAVQEDLFTLGAELACAPGKESKLKMRLIDLEDAARLERAIDAAEEPLAELQTFVLPGGSKAAAYLHLARTVTRRAERCVLAASEIAPVRTEVVVYLNRLSDLLFVLARRENHEAVILDVPWEPRT